MGVAVAGGVLVSVGVLVSIGVFVGVGDGVHVGSPGFVGEGVLVRVGVLVGVRDGVGVRVSVGVLVGVGVLVLVGVGEGMISSGRASSVPGSPSRLYVSSKSRLEPPLSAYSFTFAAIVACPTRGLPPCMMASKKPRSR